VQALEKTALHDLHIELGGKVSGGETYRSKYVTAAGHDVTHRLFAGACRCHVQMVPFAGYSLPVQYPDGVLKSHLHTRAAGCASLFDVGHMGQIKWHGKDRAKFLESVVVADVAEMKPGEAKLTLLTNDAGGIIDDSVITNHGDYM